MTHEGQSGDGIVGSLSHFVIGRSVSASDESNDIPARDVSLRRAPRMVRANMTTARELRTASTQQLRARIANGYPVDPQSLEGWAYRGTSLGLPSVVERMTWKTFQKTFYRDPTTARLIGWNVRLEQDGIDSPSRPKLRNGLPVTEWNYEVIAPVGIATPEGFDRGLIIDYSRVANPPGIVSFVKDPLVALNPGSADQLLGVSYAVVAGRCVETPTYFTLEREHPIRYVPEEAPTPQKAMALALTRTERAWAEQLFAVIIATGEDDGLPAFASIDRDVFWRTFDDKATPLVRLGLRPMVHTLTFLPVTTGFRKPFFQLTVKERERFIGKALQSRSYFVRQSIVTLKTLACLAYFDDPRVRSTFDAVPPPGVRS